MPLTITSRPSDSSWVSSVWTAQSSAVDEMTSVATETWGLVFWRRGRSAFAAVTGPETRSGSAPVPEDAEFVGIQLALGTSLRMIATSQLVDTGVELPDTTPRRFQLGGERLPTPTADDAEALIERLVRAGAITRDPLVAGALEGRATAVATRTLERRFRSSTGLTYSAIGQIVRARTAADMLTTGEAAADVVAGLGYYDEPHLARALRRYVGRTAGQLRDRVGGAIALPGLPGDLIHDLDDSVVIGVGRT
ncbi:MAG: helix-turn-helix domain-containing protein [Brevibacterium sp.]